MSNPVDDFMAKRPKLAPAVTEPHVFTADWMKRAGDPTIKPGDIVIFGFDYPHKGDPVARVMTARQARHYRRQTLRHRVSSFLARLADSVRGRK